MQSVSSRIWTHVAMSICYNDNHYATGTSKKHLVSVMSWLASWPDTLKVSGGGYVQKMWLVASSFMQMCGVLHRQITKLYIKSWNAPMDSRKKYSQRSRLLIAMAVGESCLYFSWTHFNSAKEIQYHNQFQHKIFWQTSDVNLHFPGSSSNGKEAFWLVVDSWVWGCRIGWTNYRMAWTSGNDLRTIRRRKGWVYSPLEVDRWGSHCVSVNHQKAGSWYWRNQVHPHHRIHHRCFCSLRRDDFMMERQSTNSWQHLKD